MVQDFVHPQYGDHAEGGEETELLLGGGVCNGSRASKLVNQNESKDCQMHEGCRDIVLAPPTELICLMGQGAAGADVSAPLRA